MRLIPRQDSSIVGFDDYLAYVHRFDVVPQKSPDSKSRGFYPEPASRMYVLKKARRSDGSLIGDFIPVGQIRALVELTPRMGKAADRRLTKETSLDYPEEFWLNKYFDKDLFFSLDN